MLNTVYEQRERMLYITNRVGTGGKKVAAEA